MKFCPPFDNIDTTTAVATRIRVDGKLAALPALNKQCKTSLIQGTAGLQAPVKWL